MMNQQLDNFFKEKLKNYQKPVPTAAWNKIEAGLQKKTATKWIWLKFAASLLLLSGIAYMFWAIDSQNSVQSISISAERSEPTIEKSQPKLKGDFGKADSSFSRVPFVIEKEPIRNDDPIPNKVATNKVVSRQKMDLSSVPIVKASEIEQATPNNKALPLESSKGTAPVASTPHVAPAKKSSTITLTFTAEETSQYLNKNAFAEATQDGKKSSTFKKLLQKANDLKSNQDPFGDLREKKNEILALNFKNEKRGQNK